MKISYRWLSEYIKSEKSVEQIGEYLTDLGLEVEGISKFESVKGGLNGVVVGEVTECIKHPNADRLKLTKVRVEKNKILQIVCGAPNVTTGQKVPVALIGSVLHLNSGKVLKIKASKIRGEQSHGMICAEDELGIGKSHDGILVLDDNLKIGKPLKEIFNIEEDYVFEIGLTPNRADAMSHMGVARDLKAYYIQNKIDFSWKTPNNESIPTPSNTKNIKVEIDEPELATSYFGVTLTNIEVSPSPMWIKNYLKAIGISPKNNVVDITNFVLHDMGQPLHSFDANKIEGKIIVKRLDDGTKFETLDENQITLSNEDLVICDENKPLCLAGIYGGKYSGVTDSTSSIFLESAHFDSTTIRKSSKRHDLKTDASFRFERGIDPEFCLIALKRAILLLIKYAKAVVSSEINEFIKPIDSPPKIYISYDQINKTIGQSIPKEDLTNILNALEIKIDNVTDEGIAITVPLFRVDVKRPADVIEEILRIYGYNSIKPSSSFKLNMPEHSFKTNYNFEEYVAQKLVGYGFSEIINNSIINPSYNSMTNDTSNDNAVSIINPIGRDLSELRKTLVYSSLEVISYNQNRNQKNLKTFEIGKVYFKKSKEFIENKSLLIAVTKTKESLNWITQKPISLFFEMKSLLKNLFQSLNLKAISYGPTKSSFYDDGLEIINGNMSVGNFGIIKSSLIKNFSIENEVCVCQINLEKIYNDAFDFNFKVKEIVKFPSIQRDLSLLIDKKISFDSIKKTVFEKEKKLLNTLDLFDVYTDNKIANSKKSYGIRFTFTDKEKTLTDRKIDTVMNRIIKDLETKFSIQLR